MAPETGTTGGSPAFPRPSPPGSDDLVILARDDVFYWLKAEAYQDKDHEIDTSMVSQAQLLVEQGVVLADIPVGSIPGVGAMCYLVNLSGLRPRPASPARTILNEKPAFNPTPAPAFDDLVIVDRKGTKFYWVKKAEYENPEGRLDGIDPILEAQLRLLTNQGVVIADVPGGSIPGVDDMGCLVNLGAIHRPAAKEELAPSPPPSPAPTGR